MTFNEAKTIGLTTCIDKLGRSFVKRFADTSSSAYGYDENQNSVFCFVGVDTCPQPAFDGETLTLSSGNDKFPYRASCNVSLLSGDIQMIECVVP